MKINSAKLILGTANLCTKYGNKASYINETKSKNLLNFAYKKKVKILDISSGLLLAPKGGSGITASTIFDSKTF